MSIDCGILFPFRNPDLTDARGLRYIKMTRSRGIY